MAKPVFRHGRHRVVALVVALAVIAMAGGAWAVVKVVTPGPRPDGTALTSYGWMVTPAGRQVALGDKPFGSALSPDGRTLLVSNDGQYKQSLSVIDTKTGTVRQTITYPTPEALFIGLAYSPDGAHAYASAGGNNKIRVYDVRAGGTLVETTAIQLPQYADQGGTPIKVNHCPAGIAVSADGRNLWTANSSSDSVSVVDLGTLEVTIVPAGSHPYAVALSPDGRTAYVSDWGGADLATVDTATLAPGPFVAVGTHPSALKVNKVRGELYVANTDSDTVSVVDLKRKAVIRTIDLAPYRAAPVGSNPNAFALSPLGDTLYVANAGASAVDVIALGGRWRSDRIRGRIPTGWYPTAVETSKDGRTIFVANAKGLGAGPNPDNVVDGMSLPANDEQAAQYVGSMITGTLSVIPTPGPVALALLTAQVACNNHYTARGRVEAKGVHTVVPDRVGGSSPIKHVIYVIKENRTYDQYFGSLGRGDGDPALNLFDDSSAPNQRALARRFVTLDNFYAAAEISEDGWYWSTAGAANTFIQKNWPALYSNRSGLPTVHEMVPFAASPGRDPEESYLWDLFEAAGVSYRNFGWWCNGYEPVPATAPDLAANTDPAYPGWELDVSDQTRMDVYETAFAGYVAQGSMPTVQLVRLPSDHTYGTVPGKRTPKAMVADNDLAVGRLVDMVSHSPFWKDTAIFIVEDDAQAGPDHVDAHRTAAQVISPYSQTGRVDSTFYSTVSMLRTIELIVGVPPLTQFDASAMPMLNAFVDRRDLTPYDALTPAQSLTETNPSGAPMAAESSALDFTEADVADELTLNRAVWQSVRGAGSEMPEPKGVMGEEGDED